MQTIQVNIKENSHKILIEKGLLNKIPSLLKKKPFGDRYAIISDTIVGKLYGKTFLQSMRKHGIEAELITFPSGEKSKTLQTVEKILGALLKKKFTRKDAILALGGGVTGDIAGFTASIFMRGIAYAHIPTTLLSMVDSSIGGKTGVNLTQGKNLAGTFYQPRAIWIDQNFLKTLPKEQFSNGFAEIIKYGIIKDSGLFSTFEKSIFKNKKPQEANMNKIIIRSAEIKASIIQKDEKENGERMLLNFGHTIGHAIESLSKYKIAHGNAVIIGIIIINKIALELRLIEEKDTLRINNLIISRDLLQIDPEILNKVLKPKKLWRIMQNDKKMQKSKINFIIANKIGHAMIFNKINKSTFLKFFPKKLK